MAEAVNFDKATQPWTLPWDADWVTAVTFLGPTRRVAAGNNLGQILLWDLPEKPDQPAPPPLRRLDGHTNVITRLLSTPDGRWLISASNDHTVRFWDVEAASSGTATVALNARTREDLIRRTASKVPALAEAKVETQSSARTFDGHKEWVTAMALSADAGLVVSGDDGGHVIAWERESGKELNRWRTKGWVYALALSPDTKQVFVSERKPLIFDSGRYDGVKLWDREKGEVQRDLGPDFKGQYLAAAAYAPDGKLLAVARGGELDGNNGKATLVDPATGKKVRELTPGHLNGATDLAFHPDGVHLASSGRDTLVRVWNTADGKLVKELGKSRGGQFKDWIHAVSFSQDGRWLAAADMAGSVQVWNFPS
jgi:WD40 repeat protein